MLFNKIILVLLFISFSITLCACDDTELGDDINVSADASSEINKNDEVSIDESITMPNDCEYYYTDNWTVDTLKEHFEELGFTNIRTVSCEPDDDRYNINIYELTIKPGAIFTEDWDKGEKYESDDEITIFYNESPLLTVDNCEDLLSVLTNRELNDMEFAEKYDGRYVKFEAHVSSHLTYQGGIGHVISVAGGEPKGDYYTGHIIHIGDKSWDHHINENVEEGDLVVVEGRIDLRNSEYYKCIYVETRYLDYAN